MVPSRARYELVRSEDRRAIDAFAITSPVGLARRQLQEHGIGQLKTGELERYESQEALTLMRTLKRALDPKGIMNPGKVLRDR
jgi:FAD/FMN-containing dehydrogenase